MSGCFFSEHSVVYLQQSACCLYILSIFANQTQYQEVIKIHTLLLFLLASFYSYFYLYFDLVQMRSVILCNKRICMYVCISTVAN